MQGLHQLSHFSTGVRPLRPSQVPTLQQLIATAYWRKLIKGETSGIQHTGKTLRNCMIDFEPLALHHSMHFSRRRPVGNRTLGWILEIGTRRRTVDYGTLVRHFNMGTIDFGALALHCAMLWHGWVSEY
ncbi:hypothetical protein ABVK25_006005 [Lepraria finkii]|uniref:Uncharacterized protein n=1 Tax=Lepraria finkii TaxID=1340010 RepID=A0ABR4B9Z6_9LECA